MKKVPELTALFWIMKILATTLGETTGDLLSMTLKVGYALSSLALLTLFGVALIFQLRAKSYQPYLYWAVIVSTSTAGTTVSDFMDRTLALGYVRGTLILAALLCAVLATWRANEPSLAVDKAMTRRSELFYWLAILVSNTLGTALGDFLADSSGLGFTGGALLITALLAVIMIATAVTSLSRVALFWSAFVLTRPFGATMGDVLTKSHDKGGLALGTSGTSLVLGVVLLILIAVELTRDPVETRLR